MDRKEANVTIKKKAMLFTLFAFLILIGGCGTVKKSWSSMGNSAKKSWNSIGSSVKEADQWIRDNLW